MIFTGTAVPPTATTQEYICPNSEVGTMHVGMGAVRVHLIAHSEAQLDLGSVFRK
jgi:hypothetical protein